MNIDLNKFGNIISDKESGKLIYDEITLLIKGDNICTINFENVKSMATFNAKQIFGKLYIELGPEAFFKKIEIRNANDDLKLIIRLGIQSALEDLEVSKK